jgi:hypothetical protein
LAHIPVAQIFLNKLRVQQILPEEEEKRKNILIITQLKQKKTNFTAVAITVPMPQ